MWLTRDQARQIVDHSKTHAPHEACGLVFGMSESVTDIVPIDNIAQNPNVEFIMDPQQQIQAMAKHAQIGHQLLAIYHSHPTTPPTPSPTDVRNAAYPEAVYLIVGLAQGGSRIAGWRIKNGDVYPEKVIITDTSPTPDEQDKDDTFSTPQHFAIIASALLAAMIVILLSIYLLPPAPPIPGS